MQKIPVFSVSVLIFLFVAMLPMSNAESIANAEEGRLYDQLAAAKNESAGRMAESALWEFWFDQSPSAQIRSWLDAGIKRRESYDYEAAQQYFDRIVEAAPDYAEGYNQRAFIHFLRENYASALADLEKTLQLKPNHFGALSGLYHVLRIHNRLGVAFDSLKKAVVIHPWIQERGALPKDMWPESFRKIHSPDQEA